MLWAGIGLIALGAFVLGHLLGREYGRADEAGRNARLNGWRDSRIRSLEECLADAIRQVKARKKNTSACQEDEWRWN